MQRRIGMNFSNVQRPAGCPNGSCGKNFALRTVPGMLANRQRAGQMKLQQQKREQQQREQQKREQQQREQQQREQQQREQQQRAHRDDRKRRAQPNTEKKAIHVYGAEWCGFTRRQNTEIKEALAGDPDAASKLVYTNCADDKAKEKGVCKNYRHSLLPLCMK